MKKKPNPRDVLAALLDAEIAQEITRQELDDYGLMVEPAVSLTDALEAAADEQQQQEGDSDE